MVYCTNNFVVFLLNGKYVSGVRGIMSKLVVVVKAWVVHLLGSDREPDSRLLWFWERPLPDIYGFTEFSSSTCAVRCCLQLLSVVLLAGSSWCLLCCKGWSRESGLEILVPKTANFDKIRFLRS